MRKVLFILLLAAPFLGKAQTVKFYKAINGVTYHVKDSVELNKGSAYDSTFVHIWQSGFGPGGNNNLPGYYLHTKVAIKSIKKENDKMGQRYVFMLDEGGLFRYAMDIDAAIAACEVTPCTQIVPAKQVVAATTDAPAAVNQSATTTTTTKPMVADEIKKLKALLDSGAITKKEYNAQKKKLLSQ